MIILKIAADTTQTREVEIVDEKGTWYSGNYRIFAAHFFTGTGRIAPEPHDVNSPAFLGEVVVNKERGTWAYKGNALNTDEQKQIAEFILDFKAADGVY
jgi:hypothetical protein